MRYIIIINLSVLYMEGFPLNQSQFSYVDSPVSSSNLVESLGAFPPSEITDISKQISTLREIGDNLYLHLMGTSDQSDQSEEPLIHRKQINKTLTAVQDLMETFKDQSKLVTDLEHQLQISADRTKESVNVIGSFTAFLQSLPSDNTEHSQDIADIRSNLIKISQSILDKDKTQSIKKDYMKELHIFQLYVHQFIKPLNGLNIGNTCSLCLQQPVDTYMNPCGHTGCDKCLKTMKSRGTTHCCFCRKQVNSFHKLYFC